MCTLGIFFYFLVYRSFDPNFCILEKNKKIIFDFFYCFRCRKTVRFEKKNFFLKNNKNCMILHCKNAEMTIFYKNCLILHCKNAEMTIKYCHFCIFTV